MQRMRPRDEGDVTFSGCAAGRFAAMARQVPVGAWSPKTSPASANASATAMSYAAMLPIVPRRLRASPGLAAPSPFR